jgi:2-polyprenyl-6-methoxyphenol hydroxylase-like FAD-dependent oxidoreductase
MRVAIIGAGPAGLYLAYRLKRRRRDLKIRVFEQNRAGSTFGFGVVFSERALDFLAGDDPETYAAITPHLEAWTAITIVHGGERIVIDGIGFSALGRLELLTILRQRAQSVGVEPEYQCRVEALGELKSCDLLVGADGVNSLVRRSCAQEFGATVGHFSNRFAWFGTTQQFATLSQTFRTTKLGHFNAHHYRYAPNMSTFVVEVDHATYQRAGLDQRSEPQAARLCEAVFAEDLEGHPLISNHSGWRRFPRVRNERWFTGHCVLIGDALHTAHFSIGSGTRLAIEDAIALDNALAEHPRDLARGLAAYESSRRPIIEKLVRAADRSGQWYEGFPHHMRLSPLGFAMSYITRSGRVDLERLRRQSPQFVARWEQAGAGLATEEAQ